MVSPSPPRWPAFHLSAENPRKWSPWRHCAQCGIKLEWEWTHDDSKIKLEQSLSACQQPPGTRHERCWNRLAGFHNSSEDATILGSASSSNFACVACKQKRSVLKGFFSRIAEILKLGCAGAAITIIAIVVFFFLFHMTKIHIMEWR